MLAYRQVVRELKNRLVTNPEPTQEELNLGVYLEMLEPQVRDTVRELNQKGYCTWSSGFYGNTQAVDGYFSVPPETKIELEKLNVDVSEDDGGYTTVSFTPKLQNLNAIKGQWQLISQCFPKKPSTQLSDSLGATHFRENPIRETFYVIGELEYYLQKNAVTQKAPKIAK